MYNMLKNLTYYTITNIIKDYNRCDYLINKDLELSLTFTNDKNIKDLNYKWQKRSMVTNVLSMSIFDEVDAKLANLILLGDIVISIETVAKEAIDYSISFNEHLVRLFIHGILHIFGFDHKDDTQALVMVNLENKVLQRFNSSLIALTSNYWK